MFFSDINFYLTPPAPEIVYEFNADDVEDTSIIGKYTGDGNIIWENVLVVVELSFCTCTYVLVLEYLYLCTCTCLLEYKYKYKRIIPTSTSTFSQIIFVLEYKYSSTGT